MASYTYFRGSDLETPYDYDPSPEDFGYVKMTDVPDFNWIQVQLTKTLKAIYETGDIEAMEDGLDEICSALKMKMHAGKCKLTKVV